MLSLHNWGGSGFIGTADPDYLANQFNVVAVGVDYLQTGPAHIGRPEPYDFGWLQALDALRALYFVISGLQARGCSFASDRIFTAGGSGGGNVSLMANKLAPRTFAVVVDLCGMKKLSEEIAFGRHGEDGLNARYSPNPDHPFALTTDAQEIRFLGNPAHLKQMKEVGCRAKIITAHGCDDTVCPFADAVEYARNMEASGLDFEFLPVTPERIDGRAFLATDHSLGNRTLIVGKVASQYLSPKSPLAVRRAGETDFARREEIRYTTSNGTWIVDYREGWPVGRFQPF